MIRPGDRVAGRYDVIEQLASGGMGTLWRARHVERQHEVALKVLSAEASAIALERFKREAEAAARLRSAHVVRVNDYGIHGGQPYLAMELLQGEDLAARLERQGPLPIEAVVAVLDGVAQAMTAAHAAGIVHRDLKPANIFLERVGGGEQVKVLDFGVARDLGRSTDPGTVNGSAVAGSPAYMSPEQIWGEPVGPATDVWAMGVVAFEMLTGRCPFADETLAKVFERVIRAPLPRARELAPQLPPSIDGFFEHALARAPAERFGSPGELVAALRQASLGGFEPVRAASSPLSAQEKRKASALATTQRRKRRPLTPRERSVRALTWAALLLVPLAAGWLLSRLVP